MSSKEGKSLSLEEVRKGFVDKENISELALKNNWDCNGRYGGERIPEGTRGQSAGAGKYNLWVAEMSNLVRAQVTYFGRDFWGGRLC